MESKDEMQIREEKKKGSLETRFEGLDTALV